MADVTVVKTSSGDLRGFGEDNDRAYKRFKAWLKRMEPGEFFTFSYKRQRNIKFHRKFFALVTFVAENSDTYDNKEKALVAIKLAAGHCDFLPDPKGGGLIAVPRSISFTEMDQDQFDAFYEAAVNGVLAHILPYMNRVALDQAVEEVARF